MPEKNTTREDLYRLFDDGYDRKSHEVMAFGLKKTSIDRYYFAWKKERAGSGEAPTLIEVPSSTNTVAVGGMPYGMKFIYQGETFRRMPSTGVKIIAQRLVQHQFGATLIPKGTITLDPAAQVEPL